MSRPPWVQPSIGDPAPMPFGVPWMTCTLPASTRSAPSFGTSSYGAPTARSEQPSESASYTAIERPKWSPVSGTLPMPAVACEISLTLFPPPSTTRTRPARRAPFTVASGSATAVSRMSSPLKSCSVPAVHPAATADFVASGTRPPDTPAASSTASTNAPLRLHSPHPICCFLHRSSPQTERSGGKATATTVPTVKEDSGIDTPKGVIQTETRGTRGIRIADG